MWKSLGLTAMAGIVGVTTACSGGGTGGTTVEKKPEAQPKKNDPVTLSMYSVEGGISRAVFESQIVEQVKKKFPHVTLEYIENKPGTMPEELVVAGISPDILTTGERGLAVVTRLGLQLDHRDLAKKNNLDFTIYRDEAIDAIKAYGSNGSIYALPYFVSYYATYYNKDIFDKFGIEYPKDGMTYEELFELGKKVTRQSDGVQYKGLAPGNPGLVVRGMSLSYVDPATGKPKLQTDDWNYVMRLLKDIYAYPGNDQQKPLYQVNQRFIKDKNIAILPYYGQQTKTLVETKDLGFNWDVVSYPSMLNGKGMSAEVDSNVLAVSKGSKNQDAAFEVIRYLTSDEAVQVQLARDGNALPGMKTKKGEQEFGMSYPQLKDKNFAGIFKVQLRKPHPFHVNDDIVRSTVNGTFENKYMTADIDRVTMLREMEEAAQEAISKKKPD